jgi:hypothetical protein
MKLGVDKIVGRRTFVNYLKFRWMITPDLIKLLYVLGTILLILTNIALVIGSIAALTIFSSDLGLDTGLRVGVIVGIIIIGLILILVTSLLFRMFCEQIILFFSIHEIIEDISLNTGSAGKRKMKKIKPGKRKKGKVEIGWSDDD